MRLVVDTNVLAYYLLGPEHFAEEARLCFDRSADLLAPVHWEVEIANVVWVAVRSGFLARADGPKRLERAWDFGIVSVPTKILAEGALARSLDSGVAIYDTLFVELAAREGRPLVTFDKGILKAFPEIACRPRDLV